MSDALRSIRKVSAILALSMTLHFVSAGYAGDCEPHWDNTIGQPGMDGMVLAMAVFDDGSGPALYVGGDFTEAGGVEVSYIAKWDGTSWSALPGGTNGTVHALTVFDDGTGPALYAGGDFTQANGIEVNYVAKWDGLFWSPLGSGFSVYWSSVNTLAVFDGGAGPALFAGGFTSGPIPTMGWWAEIRRWNGSSWVQAGGPSGVSGTINALLSTGAEASGGPTLFAVGNGVGYFDQTPSWNIAKWDGQSWSGMGWGLAGAVNGLAAFDDGAGWTLFAGGNFTEAGGSPASRIARWDGSAWSAIGAGMNDAVHHLAILDDGSGAGPALYAGGNFTTADGIEANRIAKWDGTSWSPLGTGMNGVVFAMTLFDDGSGDGPALYAGGFFTSAGDLPSIHIAKRVVCPAGTPVCAGDLNDDGAVDVLDLLDLFAAWGNCPPRGACAADLDDSGAVDVQDLLILLSVWGPCPE